MKTAEVWFSDEETRSRIVDEFRDLTTSVSEDEDGIHVSGYTMLVDDRVPHGQAWMVHKTDLGSLRDNIILAQVSGEEFL